MGRIQCMSRKGNDLALVVLDKTQQIESKFFAGDPATTFHELRRFLFSHGVDTKLYSHACLRDDTPRGSVVDIRCTDNAFFSEFRSMVAVESAKKRIVLNALIFTLRVFIDPTGDGNKGSVHIMMNHLHDGIFEMNEMYSALCQFLKENNWEMHSPEMVNTSLIDNMIYINSFNTVHDFTAMYWKLEPILERHQMVGSLLPIEAPF